MGISTNSLKVLAPFSLQDANDTITALTVAGSMAKQEHQEYWTLRCEQLRKIVQDAVREFQTSHP